MWHQFYFNFTASYSHPKLHHIFNQFYELNFNLKAILNALRNGAWPWYALRWHTGALMYSLLYFYIAKFTLIIIVSSSASLLYCAKRNISLFLWSILGNLFVSLTRLQAKVQIKNNLENNKCVRAFITLQARSWTTLVTKGFEKHSLITDWSYVLNNELLSVMKLSEMHPWLVI